MHIAIYDSEMQQLLVIERGFDNPKVIPPVMQEFIGKKMLYTVRLRHNNSAVIQSATTIVIPTEARVDRILIQATVPKTPANKGARSRPHESSGHNESATKKVKADWRLLHQTLRSFYCYQVVDKSTPFFNLL